MKHKGLFIAFLLFLIPGFPKDILCYLLGLGHIRQGEFLVVSIVGRLLGTALLTIVGAFFRDERYGALFTLVGISTGMILIVLIYRERFEGWFKSIHAARRIKAVRELRRSKKKHRNVEATRNHRLTWGCSSGIKFLQANLWRTRWNISSWLCSCSVLLFLFYSYCPSSFLARCCFFWEQKARIKAFKKGMK